MSLRGAHFATKQSRRFIIVPSFIGLTYSEMENPNDRINDC